MEVKSIIDGIINDTKYQTMCRAISNYSSQWEDLYQDFIIKILDKNNEYNILNARNIEVYCYVLIVNMWSGRRKKKHHKDSGTSSLYVIGDNLEDWDDYYQEITVNNLSVAEREQIAEAQRHLRSLLNSPNKKTKRQAELLKEYCNGKNRLQISKERGINYKTVHESIEEAKNIIKYKMTGTKTITKNDITIKLRAEGGKPVYSGKDKTFYSEKFSDATKAMIEKAGFKVCKK